jgi:hypothetical protein
MMLETEQFILDITNHGISDCAVGFMLSNWIIDTVRREEWLSQESLTTLVHDHNLSMTQIESMSHSVLDALEESGLYTRLMIDNRKLQSASSRVRSDIAFIELEWV